ncbi:kinesin-like protein KIF18A isoform X1 [Gadus chalcogrammus]|uniref:kinesin-like protein KIF18A isoform X1 n=2 Tax=Gadus chalcogrammus TaxID=1042646 RepID=UPI0024C47CF7|nr:kinesin-like protein KIF18A isoform X1 [Gadus chalcogrammus]XP_056463342.1 kinesin-like protein KIF18A isoform X1 [Gadus chalcogrammus]
MATDVCNHVKVVVRVRPFNSKEKGDDMRKVVHVVDGRMLIFDPKENHISSFGIPKVQKRKVRVVNKDLKFVFDNVFGEDSTQEEIFENTTKGVLDGFMIGFNCTVFAYGATGAGKTHTMLGSPDEPGVMYRTMKELYKRMEDDKEEKVFEVACSYLEVYNEQIRDLMTNVGPLAVWEDDSRKVVVRGLSLHQPKSADDILKALDHGNRNRSQHPTEMNATSSRSHAVFQIYLKQQDKNAGLNPNVCVAKMSLIDLAGSERASASNARGARLWEGSNINRSLLALGNVINVLADPKSKKGHIPYRASKLTRLLKDSLGGNCRTVMIANISPSSKMYDDTHNTLKYADRAKQIKSSLNSNVVSLNSHVGQYAVICEKQREEILKLKEKLKEYEGSKIHNMAPGGSELTWSRKKAEFKQLSDSLQAIFSGRAQIRREQLDLERQLKENALRQRHSEEANQQVHLFCAKEKTEKATCKHERRIASLRTTQQHIHDKLIEAKKRFQNNDDWLHRVENEMKLLGQNAKPPEVLEKDLYCHRLELQVNDLKQHLKQMIQLTTLQDQENKRTQKMVNILLPAHSRHRVVLTAAGLAGEIDSLENQELEQLVLRERGVVWADQDTGEQCTTDDGTSTTGGDLVPILSFSHLAYHQDSPCSAELPKIISRRLAHSSPSTKGDQGVPDKRPVRRNLSASLPPYGPVATTSAHQHSLQVTEEGMFPLQSTPLPQWARGAAAPPAAYDPNMTFEVADGEDQTADDSRSAAPAGVSTWQGSDPAEPHLSTAVGSVTSTSRGLKVPSLLDRKCAKPPYMALTSAAIGKRKLNSGIKEEDATAVVAFKRVKLEPAVTRRPLRVQRGAGSDENKPRRVVRSKSEGMLNERGACKSRSTFYKTAQPFERVVKKM